MNITVKVGSVEVPINAEDETLVLTVEGVDVLGIDLLELAENGTVTVGSWPDGENWESAVVITAKPSQRYRCSECGGIDTNHRFMPCEGGTWEPIQ